LQAIPLPHRPHLPARFYSEIQRLSPRLSRASTLLHQTKPEQAPGYQTQKE